MSKTPLQQLDSGAMSSGGSPFNKRNSNASHVLQGRSPLAPMSLLSSKKSPNKRAAGGGDQKSEAEIGEDLVRALRKDLLEIQQFIDANSSRNVLSYGMRRLESDLLGITGSAESQSIKLLKLLQEKSKELNSMMPQEVMCNVSSSSAPSPSAAQNNNGVHPSDISLLLARASPAPSNISTSANAVPVVKPLLEVAMAMKLQIEAGGGSFAHMQFSGANQSADGAVTPSGGHTPPPLAQSHTPNDLAITVPNPAANGESAPGSARSAASPILAPAGEDNNEALLPPGPAPPKPLTGSSLAHLRSLGVTISDDSAADPDIDAIIATVASVARTVMSTKGKMEKRLDDTKDVSVQRQRQQRLELDAMAHRMAEKDAELQDLKRQIASSRFGNNQQRSCTTVHDAPMSYEVERQYQRDMHRANLRISELERDYKTLFDSGIDDRQRVKDLTGECSGLREEISKMNRMVSKLEEDKEENHSLFVGVSKTRGEEARMCSVAVKQLEGRVAELQQNLRDSQLVNENLAANLHTIFGKFLTTNDELKKLSGVHDDLSCTYDDYRSVYNTQLMERLEKTQKQLLQVFGQSDEQEALITLLKQQIEDFEQQRNVTVQETQKLMEKFKGSTEFKLLGVRAPDETKQLAVRLVVLQSDKEKKESSTAAQHSERLTTFKSRAEKEVKERGDRRKAEANLVSAKSMNGELKGKELQRERQRAKEAEVAKKSERPQAQTIAEDYLQECTMRTIGFADYYDERYPPDDY